MVRQSLVLFTNSTRDSATTVLSDGSVLVAREKVGSSGVKAGLAGRFYQLKRYQCFQADRALAIELTAFHQVFQKSLGGRTKVGELLSIKYL